MCDTYVVMKDVSACERNVLCKNSDRPSFDCQVLVYHEAKKYRAGEKLKLAYVEIDQVSERYGTMGSAPYWCWGYEEGINEFGVTIGNEAVYSKDLPENAEFVRNGGELKRGLLGMELLRLGLERGKTAKEALDVMTDLIERYGQWGSGVPMQDTLEGSYNNGFIIADGKEAYALDTAGKRWAVQRITEGYRAMSNELSVRQPDLACADLREYAIAKNYWNGRGEFDFARYYIDQAKPRQVSHIRERRIHDMLRQTVNAGKKVCLGRMKRILRDHYEDTFLDGPMFNAASPDFLTVCMHESPGQFTWGITATSFIAEIPENPDALHLFYWAPCAPCCSVYIPVFYEALCVPQSLSTAGTYGRMYTAPSDVTRQDSYADGSFWWEFRELLNDIGGDADGNRYPERHACARRIFDALEAQWQEELPEIKKAAEETADAEEKKSILASFTEKCAQEAMKAAKDLRKQFAGN